MTYLGHATTLIELDGVRLLTDPVLRRRMAHLVRVGPEPSDPGPLDAVLVSHGHLDHLDMPSLRRLPRETHVVCPRGLGRVFASGGFGRVTELGEGETVEVGAVTVRATPAEHGGGKPLPGRPQVAVGYAVTGTASVYFAGDTDLFQAMDGLVPSLDLALVPIWGWGPTIGPGHLNPERAAQALALLRPRLAVPIHWGTYRPLYYSAKAEFLHQPVGQFVATAARLAPEVGVRVLSRGEAVEL